MNQIQCVKVSSLSNASSQSEAFDCLVSAFTSDLPEPVLKNLRQAVMQREEASSTYLDNGLAVPHGRMAELKEIVISVGVAPSGIDWPNGTKKAKLIIMLGVPATMITGYLVIMQKLLKWHKNTHLIHPDGSIDRLEDLQQELEKALA